MSFADMSTDADNEPYIPKEKHIAPASAHQPSSVGAIPNRKVEAARLSVDNMKTLRQANVMMHRCELMIDQFKHKNVAYGDTFGKQFHKYGKIAGLQRLADKFGRVEALMLGAENEVPDEALEDTLIDMACYCMMIIYELGVTNDGL